MSNMETGEEIKISGGRGGQVKVTSMMSEHPPPAPEDEPRPSLKILIIHELEFCFSHISIEDRVEHLIFGPLIHIELYY